MAHFSPQLSCYISLSPKKSLADFYRVNELCCLLAVWKPAADTREGGTALSQAATYT